MSHVEIEPASVQEKAAITRWFLIIPIVKVNRSNLALAEQIILDLDRPGLGLGLSLFRGDYATMRCLRDDNPVPRFAASDEKKSQATANWRIQLRNAALTWKSSVPL